MEVQNQYIQVAEKHTQALDAGRMIFEKQYPAPARRIIQVDNRVQIGTLLLVVVAAIIVSASHTVPVFMKGTGAVTGIAAFVMLEFGLVSLTYQRTREKTIRDGANESSFKWITYAIGLTLFILLVGNVYYTASHYGFTHPIADVFVVICVGVSAPALAFVSGEALALESVKAVLLQRELDAEYAAAMLNYNDAFVQWWNARKSKWVAPVKVEREPDNEAVNSLNLIKTNQLTARSKPSPRLEKAKQWLIQHPEHWQTAPRELEKEVGVSYGTIFKAQQILRAENE